MAIMVPLRELSFKAADTSGSKQLNREQIEFYNLEGYLTALNVFTASEAEANRDYSNRLLAQVADRGAYSINCYQARCRGIWDLCTEPRILDLVEDLIGPNVICWATHYFIKLPHDEQRVAWHQDASYWPLVPARTVTVWLAIDDADEENAAMQFIPRTHNRGHLKWRRSEGPAVLDQEIVGAADLGEPVSNNLRAGQVSLHADMLAHGSQPNPSGRRRSGLTLRYCPPEVEVVDARWERALEAVVCRGTDPTGRWKHHDRPATDDITNDHGPFSVGGN